MKDRIVYFFVFIYLAFICLFSPKKAKELIEYGVENSGEWERVKSENK